jgi:hypothetical protein
MKKYIIAFLMFVFANTSYAGNTTVVNAGSDSGAFHQMLTMISEKLDNTNYIQANNPVVAGTHFDKSNVLTLWSTEWPGDSSLPSVTMDKNTIVGVTAYETILCSRTYNSLSDMNGKNIKIATWGKSPAVEKFLSDLSKSNNFTFEIIPYDGSGATTRGYLGKDADTIFTIQTKQAKVEADGNCFAFSSKGELDFAFVDVIVTVGAENGTVEELRSVLTDLTTTEAWQTAFAGSATYVMNNDNATSLVNKVEAAVALNSN